MPLYNYLEGHETRVLIRRDSIVQHYTALKWHYAPSEEHYTALLVRQTNVLFRRQTELCTCGCAILADGALYVWLCQYGNDSIDSAQTTQIVTMAKHLQTHACTCHARCADC